MVNSNIQLNIKQIKVQGKALNLNFRIFKINLLSTEINIEIKLILYILLIMSFDINLCLRKIIKFIRQVDEKHKNIAKIKE